MCGYVCSIYRSCLPSNLQAFQQPFCSHLVSWCVLRFTVLVERRYEMAMIMDEWVEV